MALTTKQELFIEEYLKCFNCTRAALVAGYSPKTAYSIGSENLKKPEIAEVIKQRLNESAMSADEVLMRLAQEARGDMSDFWDIPEQGEPSLNLGGERAEGKLHLIKRMKVKTTTRLIADIETKTSEVDFELYDAQAAKTLIGRHHGLFVDKTELTGKGGLPLMDIDKLIEKVYGKSDGG
jgi:phage terminase small subunit